MKLTEEQIYEFLMKRYGKQRSDLDGNTQFIEDLEIDSLEALEINMAVDEEFGLVIEFEEADNIKTIQDFINYVKGKDT
jgi:acyl carrier protein